MKNRFTYLIKKFEQEECTPSETKELRKYFDSEESLKSYLDNEFKNFSSSNIEGKVSHEIWSGIHDKIDTTKTITKSFYNWKYTAAVAAMLLLCFGLYFNYNRTTTESLTISNNTDVVKLITLPDKSTVRLQSKSKIQFQKKFDDHSRHITLTGQAYFDVERDTLRPFSITTGKVVTQVLGTSFNIKYSDSTVTVAVSTGLVKVSSDTQSVNLRPNQMVSYSMLSDTSIEKKDTKTSLHLLWMQDQIFFDSISMEDLGIVLESIYGQRVVYVDAYAKESKIYSLYIEKNEALSNILERLNFINEVKLIPKNNVIEVSIKK
ncbi:FecR family protein [Zobellia roscoffensis]|uniref:FecR family protein n=1 Tax=Zobellia roscoffensis TaxID=2779508 RepID=UPI00188BD027|nr:FecR family protein [Zobellia roscoffensis]